VNLSDATADLQDERPAALTQLLQTLAEVLSDLAQRAEKVQHVVSPLLSGQTVEHLHDLQELDLIAQHLAALSSFVTHLEPSPAWHVDTREAGRAVPLADLARRLTRPLEEPSACDTAGGELLLFE
jgi:hypothetical protein